MSKCMTLEEVEQCDYAYLVREDYPEAECYLRMWDHGEWISFDRPLPRDGKVFGDVHSQPQLWKKYYGVYWVAFDAKPDIAQVRSQKMAMKKSQKRSMKNE